MKASVNLTMMIAVLALCGSSTAGTVIFPGKGPNEELYKEVPGWLGNGKGHDGYLSVTAKVSAASVCDKIAKPPFLGVLFKEKVQSVVTLRLAGFNSSIDGLSLPIATFDASGDENGCYGLGRMPITMVQFARFPRTGLGAPGLIDMQLNVHTTVDEASNIIPTAVALTEVAAVFTSGPAAATLATVGSTLANPVLSKLETGLNDALGNKTKASSAYSTTWTKVREGLWRVTYPIYIGETARSGWSSESSAQAINRLQATANSGGMNKLVDIVLDFSYSKTIFDQNISGEKELPSGAMIGRQRVLNRGLTGQTFLQILNSSSPSLQQEVAAADSAVKLKGACEKIDDALDKIGLSTTDRIIVKKAFIDESTGGDSWFNQRSIQNCFATDEISAVTKMYGDGATQIALPGVQKGVGELYNAWRKKVVPVAIDLVDALTLAVGRDQLLAGVLKGDIGSLMSFGWAQPNQPADSDASARAFYTKYPMIWQLTSRRANAVSCVSYFNLAQLEANTSSFTMVIADENGKRWQAVGVVGTEGSSTRLSSLEVRPLTWDSGIWAGFFPGDNACLAALGNPIPVYKPL